MQECEEEGGGMVEGDKRTGGKRKKEGKRKRAAIERIEEGKGPGGKM